MRGRVSGYLGFYLPRRFRRWFVYLPLDAALLLVLFASVLLLRAAFISADHLYPVRGVPGEVDLHLKRLEGIVERSSAASRLDLFSGYSDFCGRGSEWEYGFYVFHAMSLAELVSVADDRRAYAARQVDLSARLMLRLPSHADGEEVARRLRGRPRRSGPLITGYECLVLSIRKLLVNDTVYDDTIRDMADALDGYLRAQLNQCRGIWTSDQATQLHALWRCDQALGTDHSAVYALWLKTVRAKFVDRETGLLCSQVSIRPDRVDSPPRGTSVAWTIVFLADLDGDFAAQQYAMFKRHRVRRIASLSAVAEFPGCGLLEFGDLDSGPMVLGISPSATGFGLCAHRLYGERSDYARCYRLFELFGQPRTDGSGKYYRLGNGMGDAILLYSKIARSRKTDRPQKAMRAWGKRGWTTGSGEPFRRDVFVSGQGGYHTYRIPALVLSADETLLAFCEGRKRSPGDQGDIDLLLKRSKDGGRSWSEQTVVHEEGGNAPVTIGNPCPIVERGSKRIHLLFTRNNKRLFYTRSTDDGLAWSAPRELTGILKGFDYPWVRIATGPVHGIQMKSGRLVAPVWVSDRERRDRNKNSTKSRYRSGSIHSDDNGTTWKTGSLVSPEVDRLNEGTVVERNDGSLLLNIRAHRAGFRAVSLSKDGGATWSGPVLDKSLPCPTCQASMIRFSERDILFLNPAGGGRKHLTLRLSSDEGKSWSHAGKINQELGAYSDMAVTRDGRIFCLFENGIRKYHERISIVELTRGWLTAGKKTQQGTPPDRE